MHIGKEIKKACVDSGKTLKQVAAEAGMRREYFSSRINGHVEFRVEELCEIGEVLNVPGYELMRRAEEAARNDTKKEQP